MKKTKFGIWRHENSIGNSAEHTIGLALYLKKNNINPSNVEVYVEHEWQKYLALCIEGVEEDNVKLFEHEVTLGNMDPYFDDIHMPIVYGADAFKLSYECGWSYLEQQKDLDVVLKFDTQNYENKFNLPNDAIVLFHREAGTWNKRVDGNNFEPERFVDPEAFHKLALYYADLGYEVIKLGDKNQAPLPGKYNPFEFGAEHENPNIYDFTKYLDEEGNPLWTLQDYLYVLQNCKVFISCDAGIWPMAAAMGKNLVFCNVTSIFNPPQLMMHNQSPCLMIQKPEVINWLSADTTQLLTKNFHVLEDKYVLRDNTLDEIVRAAKRFL